MTEARVTTCTGAVQPCGRTLKSQCTMVGGGVLPPLPQTGGCWTLMDTPLQVRLWATGIGTEAAEGVGSTAGTHKIGYANL